MSSIAQQPRRIRISGARQNKSWFSFAPLLMLCLKMVRPPPAQTFFYVSRISWSKSFPPQPHTQLQRYAARFRRTRAMFTGRTHLNCAAIRLTADERGLTRITGRARGYCHCFSSFIVHRSHLTHSSASPASATPLRRGRCRWPLRPVSSPRANFPPCRPPPDRRRR